MNVNTTDLKTKATKLAGWIKHQPKALLIPVALFIAIALAAGFHHYVQRSKAAEVKAVAAAQANGDTTGGAGPYLPGIQSPAGLNEDTAQQVTACPGAPDKATVLQAMEATFAVPVDTPAGCVVTWQFYSRAVPDYSWAEDRKTGVKHALVELDASGTPAADVTLTVDGVSVHSRHQARDELGSALSPRDVLAGWHSYSIAVRVMPAPSAEQGPWRSDPKPLQISLRVAHPIAAPYWTAAASTASSNAIPHIAQQPPTSAGVAAVATTAPTIALQPAPVIEPPAGVQAGEVTEKTFSQDQWGQWALVTTSTIDARRLNLRGSSTNGRRVVWSAWIDLAEPVTVAVLRVATGPATVTASIDGSPLGQPMDYTPFSGPASQTATVSLAPGWHEVEVQADRGRFAVGPGVAVQVALGDGSADPQPPQPWAVPPAAASASIPRNACAHDTCAPSIPQHAANAPAPASATSAP